MELDSKKIEPYAPVIIHLLKGIVYQNDKVWNQLLNYELSIRGYLEKIGIALVLNKVDGFAYLTQPEIKEDAENNSDILPLPRLTSKTAYTYYTSLTLCILREWYEEFEAQQEHLCLIVSEKAIKDRIDLFFKKITNETKTARKLKTEINKVVNATPFLKKVKNTEDATEVYYEIMPIIKAKITNDKVEEFKEKLKQKTANEK